MGTFEPYTSWHFAPVTFFAVLCLIAIRVGKKYGRNRQTWIGLGLALLPFVLMVGGSVLKLVLGTYRIDEDLPLYLCRLVAWMLPVVILLQRRMWMGVFYFWILAGTLQGIVTPDLVEGFPSYFYFATGLCTADWWRLSFMPL